MRRKLKEHVDPLTAFLGDAVHWSGEGHGWKVWVRHSMDWECVAYVQTDKYAHILKHALHISGFPNSSVEVSRGNITALRVRGQGLAARAGPGS